MKEEMRLNESGEGEQGETADGTMKRTTGRIRESEKERDGQMNRGEERYRQADKSNRHLQPHRQYKEVPHLGVRDTECVF